MLILEFILEQLMLIPFLFVAYLAMEWIETRSGNAVERFLRRAGRWEPFAGAVAGVVPQCGFSAAAASLYAGGVVTAGTLIAVFLSTSDELIPVLLSKQIPALFVAKIVGLKVVFAICAGLAVNAFIFRKTDACRGEGERRDLKVGEICARSHCGCCGRNGVFVSALIHTAEMFAFLLVVSALIEVVLHSVGGEDAIKCFVLNRPVLGELVGGLVGMIPNCAASAACAELYAEGGMSAGALLASSLTGAGVGFVVLFKTNRHLVQNIAILIATYIFGVVFGCLGGIVL